jgi:hypothetical protein
MTMKMKMMLLARFYGAQKPAGTVPVELASDRELPGEQTTFVKQYCGRLIALCGSNAVTFEPTP